MSSDKAGLLVFALVASFALLLGFGIWFSWRRTKQREALARVASMVRVSIAGPMLNRRALTFALPMFLFAFAMGALTKKGGPVSQSNPWIAALLGLVLLVGAIGAAVSAMTHVVGIIELDKERGRLRFQHLKDERLFNLKEPLELREFTVPPGGVYTYGGSAFELRQGDVVASCWYPDDLRSIRSRGDHPVGLPQGAVRVDGLGRVIHEYLRDLAATQTSA